MFNIGGIMSGIGDVGYMKVKKGIQAKHDQEKIRLQSVLAKMREKESRGYSRQIKMMDERKVIKNNMQALQALGFNAETAAGLASNNKLTDLAETFATELRKRTDLTGENADVNYYWSTANQQRKTELPEKFEEFNATEFLANPHADKYTNISAGVKMLRNIPEDLSSEEMLARANENVTKAQITYNKTNSPKDLKAYEEALNKFKIVSQSTLQSSVIKKAIIKTQKKGLGVTEPYRYEDFSGILKNLNAEIRATFNTILKEGQKSGSIFLDADMKIVNTNDGSGGFTILGENKQAVDVMYNLLSQRIVQRELTFLSKDETMQPYIADLQTYFSQFITPRIENLTFQGAMTDDANIPTTNFLDFIKDKADKVVMIPSTKTGIGGQQQTTYDPFKFSADEILQMQKAYKDAEYSGFN